MSMPKAGTAAWRHVHPCALRGLVKDLRTTSASEKMLKEDLLEDI